MHEEPKAAVTPAWIAGLLGCIGVVLAAAIGLGLPLVHELVQISTPLPNAVGATETASPSPTSSHAPTQTAVRTRTPTATHTPIAQPLTPMPPQYAVVRFEGIRWCEYTELCFTVLDRKGPPKMGTEVHVWSDSGYDDKAATDMNGNAKIRLADEPVNGIWSVQLLEDGIPVSDVIQVSTSADCEENFQVWNIHWSELRAPQYQYSLAL